MRILFLLFLICNSLSSKGQNKNPFPPKCDKVIICDFENDGEHSTVIVDNKGQITSAVKKHVQLNDLDTKKLNQKLGERKSFGKIKADCFEPHFGIVYYNKNKVVGVIQICLSCNVLSSTIEIPAQKQGTVGHGNKAYYLNDGMSKSFRKFINTILKKYNFSHQIEAGSHFDK